MSGSRLLISIPDKSIGFAPGDEITINAHPLGLNGQKVTVRFLINDPLGATVHSIRAEERQVPDEGSSLAFSHTVDSDACSGSHLITAQLHSEAMNLREMATESFDVVIPGERLPDGFPAAQRDHLVESRHPFATATTGELAEAFETAHEACEPIRNDNGSWGVGEDGIPAAYRTPGNVTLGYLYGYEATGEKVYLDRATGGLDYLLAEQEPTGAYRWWRAGYPEGVLNDRDSFYDTGWAGLALAGGRPQVGRLDPHLSLHRQQQLRRLRALVPVAAV